MRVDIIESRNQIPAYPERHLQILPTPNIHALIIRAKLIEVVSVDGEKTSGHGRGAKGGSSIPPTTIHFSLGDSVPGQTLQNVISAG